MIKHKEFFEIFNTDQIHLIANDDKAIPQPHDITLKLKNYQKATIYQMFLREQKSGFFIDEYNFWASNIGILGEDVGVGKTFITLGLISHKKEHKYYYPENPSSYIRFQMIKNKTNIKNINENFLKSILDYFPKYCNGISVNTDFYLQKPEDIYMPIEPNVLNNLNTNLIVLPHNLIQQWRDDIENHTNLTYYYISNIRHLRKIKEEGINILDKYNIVLCNASKYNQLVEMTAGYRWERVFFDEAHSINIPKSKFIPAKFYWFITATYKSIVGLKNTGFLRNLINVYKRKLRQNNIRDFNKFILKTNNDCVKKEFKLPEPIKLIHICAKPLWIKVIEKSIDSEFPNLKEMMYAELNVDMKRYLYNFDSLIFQNELADKNVVLIYLKWLISREKNCQRKVDYFRNEITQMILRMPLTNISRYERQIEAKRSYVIRYTTRAEHYKKLRYRIKRNIETNQLCWICLKKPNNFVHTYCKNGCNNVICQECKPKVENWITEPTWGKFCFYCLDENYRINENTYSSENLDLNLNLKTKFEKVCDLLNDETGEKRFLIFSNYTSLFNKYLEKFKTNKMKYGILKGNNNVINKRMRDFKQGKINVLLLNGRFYGSGLNLQDATDIIVTHKITTDVETQVIGRANRMGRKGILNVHYLAFDGELT